MFAMTLMVGIKYKPFNHPLGLSFQKCHQRTKQQD